MVDAALVVVGKNQRRDAHTGVEAVVKRRQNAIEAQIFVFDIVAGKSVEERLDREHPREEVLCPGWRKRIGDRAEAINHRFDPFHYVDSVPVNRVMQIPPRGTQRLRPLLV